MSLPAGERRKLRAIARAEARADPELATRFFIFSQVNWDEDMPRTERLSARAVRRQRRAERGMVAYLMWRPEPL
jgi:hypothetical protein